MSDGAKVVFGLVAGFIGLLLIGVLLHVTGVYVIGGVQRETADFRGETDAIEKTRADGDYRIAAYESFYDTCSSIQALEDQIKMMKADKSLPADQRSTNVLALTNQRNTLIREYNADARKSDTRGNFLASDLPYQIDPTEETTTCTR